MKNNRHVKIMELIKQGHIETQEELADKLREAGFAVTQATVSRDIRSLKLSRIVTNEGKLKYVFVENDNADLDEKYVRVLKDGLLSMDIAGNILVLKTVSGMAMAAAAAIDAIHFPEIAGCIAGDDTVMCAVRNAENTPKVMVDIQKLIKQ